MKKLVGLVGPIEGLSVFSAPSQTESRPNELLASQSHPASCPRAPSAIWKSRSLMRR
jgi:hypothetical protein